MNEVIHEFDMNPDDSSPQEKRVATIKAKWDHSEATKNMKNNFDNGQNIKVINEATAIIKDLQIEILLMLELQAMAYKREGRYIEEIQAAKTIITYAPDKATGYLLAGYRYANLGYQAPAIDVFDKGLIQVPETHPDYTTLVQGKDQARKRLDQKVDFLKQLPYDITCRIIDLIPVTTVTHCSRVSSAWRKLVLNYPMPWNNIDASDISEIDYKECLHPIILLPSVSQHVKIIKRLPYGDQYQKPFLKLLGTNNFMNLHSLRIECDGDQQDFYTILSSALTNVSATLRSLDVYSDKKGGLPNVSHILSICRNLTSFKLSTLWLVSVFSPFNLPCSTNLINFELYTYKETITAVDLKKFLQASPNIRWLSIQKCDTTGFYESVQKYCPSINVLILGKGYINWHTSDKWYADLGPNDGLQAFAVTQDMVRPGFMALLEKQCIALRRFDLGRDICYDRTLEQPIFNSTEWSRISTLDFSNITHFTLSDFESNTIRHHVGGMLKHMLNLETLNLSRINDDLPSSIFKSIKEMHKLSELSIDYCFFNHTDIHQLLESFAQNTTKSSTLHTLTISGGSFDETAMEICGQIKSLKSLVIYIDPKPLRPSMERFVKNVSQLTKLEKLRLKDMYMAIVDLQALSTIKSLRHIEFDGFGGIGEDDVLAAFSSDVYTEFYPIYKW